MNPTTVASRTTDNDTPDRIGQILLREGAIQPTDLSRALGQQGGNGLRVGDILVQQNLCTQEQVLQALAEQFSLPFAVLRETDIDPEALRAVPSDLALRHLVLPLSLREGTLRIAVSDPFNFAAEEELRLLTGLHIETVLTTSDNIDRLLEEAYVKAMFSAQSATPNGSSGEDTGDIEFLDKDETEIGNLEQMAREATVIGMVNMLLRQAVQDRASDVHIEPFEKGLRVRYRVDGVLHEMSAPPKRLQAAVVSRVKIMADLDIAERRLPQDGRIKLRVSGREIDLRVSTVPTLFGESVVMRILEKTAVLLGLEELGMLPDTEKQVEELVKRPHGIILVTGPTGSGKTTTLYAALRKSYSSERKIITIEDPVEYQLDGVNQIQVRPKIGLTFANGLRHIVRQDPDIIMVGEIRDAETAEIAIHAALTGHLVFSTLHTNDAAGAVTRLVEMGIEPYLVASSVEGVLAQRLVRVVCANCKRLEQSKRDTGPAAPTARRISPPPGCDECKFTGYKGRTGIF
ncbi:MAG: Flp pilus assembly complex ATPase component TadA, partial [Armatimonadetes bacterium]|nr:Flp pilus assembly complex ATPase component TadA [Armatimonadota bacterium]